MVRSPLRISAFNFNPMTHGAQRNVGSLATAQRVGRHWRGSEIGE
jgi:hypothetical protein